MHAQSGIYYTSLNNFLKSTLIFFLLQHINYDAFFQIKVLYTLLNSRAQFNEY